MNIRPAQKLYWVYVDQKVHGPFTIDQITKLPGISERTRICPENSQEWTTVGELAAALEPKPATEAGRRCPNCSRKARGAAKFCEHCGTILGDGPPGAPLAAPSATRRSLAARLLTLLAIAALGGAFAYGRRELGRRRKAQEPTGRVRIEVQRVVHAKTLRDVRGEERSPLPGKRFCLVTLLVRDPDPVPALFDRKRLRWEGPDKRAVEIDGLTPFLPGELRDAPRLEPQTAIQGRVLFQVPLGVEKFRLFYGGAEIPLPPGILQAEKRWLGREDEAIRLLKAFRCRAGEGRPRPWDPNIDMQSRQELGPLYHVDAEDYSFHVDLDSGRINSATDVETLVAENTRRDCFAQK